MSGAHWRGRDRADAPERGGPRTSGGKARSARNAFRHGLSVSVLDDPVTASEVEALTLRIAPDPDAQTGALARRVAQAQVDLVRVRRVRHELLAAALGNLGGGPRSAPAKLAPRAPPSQRSNKRPDQASDLLSDLASRLTAMNRYERDALSRRKFAIRDFDAAFVSRTTKRTRRSSMKTASARISLARTSEAQRSQETGRCPELQNEPENHQWKQGVRASVPGMSMPRRGVVPAKAGTHTPVLSIGCGVWGPGSSAGTTPSVSCDSTSRDHPSGHRPN